MTVMYAALERLNYKLFDDLVVLHVVLSSPSFSFITDGVDVARREYSA